MKNPLFRVGLGVVVSLAAGVVAYLSAGLAIALSIAVGVAMLAAAFVAAPLSLVGGAHSRQSYPVPILLATSMALSAIGAALSDAPSLVVPFLLGMLALIVPLARSVVTRES